jgi:hypothetical protein
LAANRVPSKTKLPDRTDVLWVSLTERLEGSTGNVGSWNIVLQRVDTLAKER